MHMQVRRNIYKVVFVLVVQGVRLPMISYFMTFLVLGGVTLDLMEP